MHSPRTGAPNVEAVLHASHRLLAQGLDRVTVRAVADELGVSRQVVYSRFGSKTGLLEALYVDGFRQLEAEVRAVAGPAGTDRHMVDVGAAYRRFALEHRELFALMFRESDGFSPSDDARAEARGSFECVVDATRAWLANHSGARAKPTELAASVWSAVHGSVSLELAGHRSAPVSVLVARVLRGVV